jgi:HEAT repeats
LNDPVLDAILTEEECRCILAESQNPATIVDALMCVAKGDYRALLPDVSRLLQHAAGEVRAEAIVVLGFYFRQPEAREIAEQMMEHDPDPWARYQATDAWAAYWHETRDPVVSRRLYDMATDTERDPLPRAAAARCLCYVVGLPPREVLHFDAGDIDTVDWRPYLRLVEEAERLGPVT